MMACSSVCGQREQEDKQRGSCSKCFTPSLCFLESDLHTPSKGQRPTNRNPEQKVEPRLELSFGGRQSRATEELPLSTYANVRCGPGESPARTGVVPGNYAGPWLGKVCPEEGEPSRVCAHSVKSAKNENDRVGRGEDGQPDKTGEERFSAGRKSLHRFQGWDGYL